MRKKPARSCRRRWLLPAGTAAAYLLIVSPFCLGSRKYLEIRNAHRLSDAVRLPLVLAGAPAEILTEVAWPDGGIAFTGWVHDLAEEHDRRAARPDP